MARYRNNKELADELAEFDRLLNESDLKVFEVEPTSVEESLKLMEKLKPFIKTVLLYVGLVESLEKVPPFPKALDKYEKIADKLLNSNGVYSQATGITLAVLCKDLKEIGSDMLERYEKSERLKRVKPLLASLGDEISQAKEIDITYEEER